MSSSPKKITVGVICGGKSTEHEVSLASARNVVNAIDKNRFDVKLLKVEKSGAWSLLNSVVQLESAPALPKFRNASPAEDSLVCSPGQVLATLSDPSFSKAIDVVFPIVHGAFGEDGCLQGLLRTLDIPFVGASVLGSAVGMDKDVMKRLLQHAGLPTPQFRAIHKHLRSRVRFADLARELGLPFFVKPANSGSSVGVAKVKGEADFDAAVDLAFRFDEKVLIEEAIVGRELECAILGNENPTASMVGEIVAQDEFYSYEAKYIDENGAVIEIPANIAPAISDLVRRMATDAYKCLCCSGMARVDFFLTEDQRVLINEINTIPGFTNISMYPKLWEASGVSYSELISRLIDLALERHKDLGVLLHSYDAAVSVEQHG